MNLGEIKSLSDEEFENIVWGDAGYSEITDETITDQDRWHTYFEQVFEKNGEFFEISWARGSTEMQEIDLNATIRRVEKKEKLVIVYE